MGARSGRDPGGPLFYSGLHRGQDPGRRPFGRRRNTQAKPAAPPVGGAGRGPRRPPPAPTDQLLPNFAKLVCVD